MMQNIEFMNYFGAESMVFEAPDSTWCMAPPMEHTSMRVMESLGKMVVFLWCCDGTYLNMRREDIHLGEKRLRSAGNSMTISVSP